MELAAWTPSSPKADPELDQLTIGANQHVELAVPKRHPLAKLKKLRLRDLVDATFVWFPRWASPAFYDQMMEACYRGGLKSPRVVQEGNNEATILSLAFRLFTLSWNGRGIFDLHTFEQIARAYEDPVGVDWFAADQLSAAGIGEFSGQMIPIVGLCGGQGHVTTPDGWRLESRVDKGSVLSSSLIDPTASNVMTVPLNSITEYRAVSFNPSGRFLLLASTSEAQVMARGPIGER